MNPPPSHTSFRDDGTPMYRQIADALLARIQAQDIRVGDRVESEPEIVAAYGVSRATATRALEHLAQQGVVRRVQGRGTFVQVPALMLRRPLLGSFSAGVRAGGHRPTHRLLGVGDPDGSEDPRLHAHFAGTPVVRVDRLRLVDDVPAGVHRSFVARAGVAADDAELERALSEPEASLYALMAGAGAHIAHAEEHLDAVLATAEDRDRLGLPDPSALIRVVRLSTDAAGRPLEATDARYAGERFDYRVTLAPPTALTPPTKERP